MIEEVDGFVAHWCRLFVQMSNFRDSRLSNLYCI